MKVKENSYKNFIYIRDLFVPEICTLLCYIQQHSAKVFRKNLFSLKIPKLCWKAPLLESLFNNVADLQACKFIKRRLKQKCLPVKLTKFLRILNSKNIFA